MPEPDCSPAPGLRGNRTLSLRAEMASKRFDHTHLISVQTLIPLNSGKIKMMKTKGEHCPSLDVHIMVYCLWHDHSLKSISQHRTWQLADTPKIVMATLSFHLGHSMTMACNECHNSFLPDIRSELMNSWRSIKATKVIPYDPKYTIFTTSGPRHWRKKRTIQWFSIPFVFVV